MEKELILIRHAHSEWQAGITRNKNSHLSRTGILQAGRLLNCLGEYIDVSNFHIVSSPLHRAIETGLLALPNSFSSDVVFDDNFQEASFDIRDELKLPEDFYPDIRIQASEKYLIFKARIKFSLAQLLSQYKRIIIFTHGGVIKTILRLHCGSDAFCIQIDNCSITHFIHTNKIWLLQRVNHKC